MLVHEGSERLPIAEEAELMSEIRRAYKITQDLADELEADYKARQQRLKDRMEAERIKGIKVGDVNYVPAETVYANVQDLAALVDWAEAEGHTEFLKTAANKEALNEEVRRRLDDGEELPPGVSFNVREYVSQRAA